LSEARLASAWPGALAQAERLNGGGFDAVPEETPVAIAVNGVSQVVMFATPQDLEDFAIGFAYTEAWIEQADEVLDLEVQASTDGIVLDLRLTARREQGLQARRRQLAGRSGCGLCGVESLAELPRLAAPAPERPHSSVPLGSGTLQRAAAALPGAQVLNQACGGLHAAAWFNDQAELRLLREDVGRHNALDKLIGAMLRQGVPASNGFVFMSSRASDELVHKAARAGLRCMASVSAPTARAISNAQACGLQLWAFVREGRATRYA
jgi:FdhD protein